MATPLKNIQFNIPMLVGEANANNGTTFALGSHDVLGPIAQESFTPPGETSSQAMWGFDGVAEYAKYAVGAESIYYGSGGRMTGDEIGNAVSKVGHYGVVELSTMPGLGSSFGSLGEVFVWAGELLQALGGISARKVVIDTSTPA